MSGTYGTVRPANITPNDVEIWYSYRESRNSDIVNGAGYSRLSSSCLSRAVHGVTEGYDGNFLEGLYNLKLPVNYFYRKGFYSVYIKPKEHRLRITNVGTLATERSVRGIVFDSSETGISDPYIRGLVNSNNGIVGYRIQYLSQNGVDREDYYRIVTSNFRCEPISSSDGSKRYAYNDSSTLVFVTLTPSAAPSFNPNINPYIGSVGQSVILTNTKFSPILLDIEMTEHDSDTISNMLEGSKLRDLDNGLITTFDEDGNIYHQSEHFSVKDEYTGKPMFEANVRRKDDVDFSQEEHFNDIVGNN